MYACVKHSSLLKTKKLYIIDHMKFHKYPSVVSTINQTFFVYSILILKTNKKSLFNKENIRGLSGCWNRDGYLIFSTKMYQLTGIYGCKCHPSKLASTQQKV
jgi:hypothetical protein